MKKPKTTLGLMWSFVKFKNPIVSVVVINLSFRQKTLLLCIIGYSWSNVIFLLVIWEMLTFLAALWRLSRSVISLIKIYIWKQNSKWKNAQVCFWVFLVFHLNYLETYNIKQTIKKNFRINSLMSYFSMYLMFFIPKLLCIFFYSVLFDI